MVYQTFGKTLAYLRKPADRLGKVVFANEVSIGGVGGELDEVHKKITVGW